MSNLISLISSSSANALAVSVLPTPVGPTNKKLPIGLLGSLSPALLTNILSTSLSTASFCPNTFFFILVSSLLNPFVSFTSTTSCFILASLDTCATTESNLTIFLPNTLVTAPAASTMSNALSGKYLFLTYLSASSQAFSIAPSSYLTLWNSS